MNPADLLPPSAPEAEAAALGSLILSGGEAMADVSDTGLTPAMFHAPKNRVVAAALTEMSVGNETIDMVTLTQHLADKGKLDAAGGVDYLIELSESVPSAASAAAYARQVVEAFRKRQIQYLASEILRHIGAGGQKAAEIAHTACSELEGIVAGQESAKLLSRQEAAQAAYEEIERRAEEGPISGVRTGFPELDDCLAGLKGGNLYLIAARPGMGKTALALQLATNAAAAGHAALFVSIEMPPDQVGMRDLAYSSGLSLGQVRNADRLSRDDWGRLQMSVGAKRDDLHILDASGMMIEQIESNAKRLKAAKGIGLIVIDYLQLMAYPSGMSKYEAVGRNSKMCKQLARKLDVPVILLSQVNRTSEHTGSRRPSLAGLRDSGEIEESADAVMLIHREDYYRLQEDAHAILDHIAEISVAKNRHGPTGMIELEFRGGAFSNPIGPSL